MNRRQVPCTIEGTIEMDWPDDPHGNAVVLRGTGNPQEDDRNLDDAVKEVGELGTIYPQGKFVFRRRHQVHGVSLVGQPDGSTVFESHVNDGYVFSWDHTLPDASWRALVPQRFSQYVQLLQGAPPTLLRGTWIQIQSDDELEGMPPHFSGGTQHPLELHRVQHYEDNRIYVESPIVDQMSHHCVIRPYFPVQGVCVKNLHCVYGGEDDLEPYTTFFRFDGIDRLRLDNVHFERRGPGAILFQRCSQVVCDGCTIEGQAANDRVYGFVLGSVNGVHITNSIISNTRHPFTTTHASTSGNSSWGTPINVRFHSNIVNVTGNTIGLDTHAPGYGIVFSDNLINVCGDPGGQARRGAQSRSRATVFRNNEFRGTWDGPEGPASPKGLALYGEDSAAIGNRFTGFWLGVQVIGPHARNCVVRDNHFEAVRAAGVMVLNARGTQIIGNHFRDCGRITPFAHIKLDGVDHRVSGNHLARNHNRHSVHMEEESTLIMTGNDCTGYGGRQLGISGDEAAEWEQRWQHANFHD